MSKALGVDAPNLSHPIQKRSKTNFFHCVKKGRARQAALWSFGRMMDILQR